MTSEKLIVIGAGPMGLAAAYHAVKLGFDVDVLEADDRIGGMAAHFDFEGLSIERFYHFCCLSDDETLALLVELGMPEAMQWVPTTMGYFVDGELHPWGDPIALLRFPKLNLIEKLRYGLQAFTSTKRSDWRKLDQISAKDWFVGWCGQSLYDRMWRRLLELKFYEFTDEISAAWIWQRMKRVGNSRASLFEERLGYIDGGSETLMNALAEAITRLGGRIHLSARAKRFDINDGAIEGVELTDGRRFSAPQVISTVATPYAAELFGDDHRDLRAPYDAIKNIGVICLIFKLRRPVTPHFWVNISDESIPIPGIIEFSNLRPLDDNIVYVPYYMPADHPRFAEPNEIFIAEALECLKRVNPEITDSDVIAIKAGRLKHAQPICEVGFADMIPPVQTPVKGLQIADTCYYYPEDRGVSESAKLARSMVANAAKAQGRAPAQGESGS